MTILRDTLAIVCQHVISGERKVGLIVHHSDDQWSFMCGDYDHDSTPDAVEVVHLGHLFDEDHSLEAASSNLPKTHLAERTLSGWTVAPHDD